MAGQEKDQEVEGLTDQDVAFVDFPADAFPFTIELLNAATRKVVWTATITGPGAIHIPGLDETGPDPKITRVTYADGTIDETDPPDKEQAG